MPALFLSFSTEALERTTIMTIKVSVGVSKKIGLPDYGSAGGHCNIEIEADNSLLDNPDQFLQRVKDAYEMARQSVEEELSHHRPGNAPSQTRSQSNAATAPAQQRQGYQQEQRPDYRSDHSTGGTGGNRIASAKQQQFIAGLVKGIKGLDWRTLDRYCDVQFGKACSQLSSKEASALIEDLKTAKSGGGLPV